MQPKSIIFKINGGPRIGMGHVTRTLELANEFKKKGFRIIGFVSGGDPIVGWKIKEKGFRVLPTVVKGADAIIIDQPKISRHFTKSLKRKFPALFLASLDNFNMTDQNMNMIVNLVNHHPSLKRPVSRNVRYFEGVKYGILRREFDLYRRRAEKVAPEARNILVSFGGADPQNHSRRVVNSLKYIHGKPVFHFVFGANYRYKNQIIPFLKKASFKSKIYRNIGNMAAVMAGCDMGVIGGGTTMLEMATLGIPALVLPQSQNESRFASKLARMGLLWRATVQDMHSPYLLGKKIFELMVNQVARKRMSLNGRKSVDGRGRERIVQLFIRNYQRDSRVYL